MCGRLIGLAEDLLLAANRNLIGDLLAAAASVRAAAEISRASIEANMTGIRDDELAAEHTRAAADATAILVRADHLAARVRRVIAQSLAT